ncbi:DUF6603 domain-containing protein [Halovivax gelatinilyticus]|uniref:DUF6603 domain-containing protein n=1 Tax=Halovivax gelatinilyticus TaxID=2961597 RepID=UPI0020CA43B2|nr:DUF6603 domain-containing protein [Halovivax gelatinilyticus]
MTGNDTLHTDGRQTLARELTYVVEPVTDAVDEGFDGIVRLLAEAGLAEELQLVEIEQLVTAVQDAGELFESLQETVQSFLDDEEDVDDVVAIVDSIGDLVDTIRSLDEIEVASPHLEDIGRSLLDYLLLRYLVSHQHDLFAILSATGVIQDVETAPYKTIEYSRVPTLLDDPNQVLDDQLDLDEADAYESIAAFVATVADASSRRFLPASRSNANPESVATLLAMDDADEIDQLPTVDSSADLFDQTTVDLVTVPLEDGQVVLGLHLVPLPETANDPAGVGVLPAVLGTLATGSTTTFGADDQWTFSFSLSGEANVSEYGAVIRPLPDGIETEVVDRRDDGAPIETSLRADASIEYDGSADDEYQTILGDEERSHVGIGPIGVTVGLEHADDETTVTVETPVNGIIGVQPSDGFLASVLPDDGIEYEFDALVGWSARTGLYFENGGTLEAEIPQNAELGPVTMKNIHVGVLPSGITDDADPGLTISAAASASIELGPMTGTVQRMGIKADVAFPEDRDGSLGPVDLDIGIDPPDGIGLAIDAEGVSGGGFLELDHENNRYAGAVQLHVGELTFNAVGLLTTELPDGSDGFSLLVLITAEFPPIELGLGFTLNGLGGLVGVHRSVKSDPLQQAVRDGSLDSVLFPQDVVENAPRIVSDLRATFPPTADYHVFGPMARLGWGTPELITADLGVLVEFPSVRIIILGRLSAVLPDDIAPLVELNAGVLGEIDPAVPELEIHASLYDSRVMQWELSGDFGVRIRGGDQPDFLLSAGGFHPQYEPPETFADMRRLRASLGVPGGNPSLDLKGYFAVTSNTVQAGADLSFFVDLGVASVDGDLGFDALVQFDPFEFLVDIYASLTVKALKTTFSVSLDGSLSGPAPWHVDGEVEVSIALASVSFRVDTTFGSADDRDALPPVDVLDKLTHAVEQPGNWQTTLPDEGESPVTLRDPVDRSETDGESDETPPVLVHPQSAPAVRQTVVPLSVEIERFGNAEPADADRFEITSVDADGSAELDIVDETTEQFSPGEYFDLSDDERLDSPAFESMQAGYRLDSGGVYAGQAIETGDDDLADNGRITSLSYETSIRDERCDNYDTPAATIEGFDLEGSCLNGSITRQFTRASIDRDALGCDAGPAPKETVDDGTTPSESGLEGSVTGDRPDRRYQIVRSDTFEPVDLDGNANDGYGKAEAKRTIERHAADGATGRYQVVAAAELE